MASSPSQIQDLNGQPKDLCPRLCHLKKGPTGYGFNLHSEKARPGQFIRSVDPDSPASKAGLRPQDKLVEVTDDSLKGGGPRSRSTQPPPEHFHSSPLPWNCSFTFLCRADTMTLSKTCMLVFEFCLFPVSLLQGAFLQCFSMKENMLLSMCRVAFSRH